MSSAIAWSLLTVGALLLTTALSAAAANPEAAPAASKGAAAQYSVTMVARSCATYADVFANRSRNNIMESLRDLGPNSPYTSFTQVHPSVEDGLAPQSGCTPLAGWTFSFGTGINRPVPGTNLSYVTGTSSVAGRQVTTQSSVPLLDGNGDPSGSSIAGATTFTLSPTEVSLATRSSAFWVMGGTPSAPLNGSSAYGFAALRCATDNVNGDNVEWIGYPSGTTHVFCFAFYVKPPPTPGTITIVKQLGVAQPAAQTFNFAGNVSFNPGGKFSITLPASSSSAAMSFTRGATLAGDAPWTASEQIPDGYELTGLLCSSSGGSSFSYIGSSSASTVAGGHDGVSVTLAGDDAVTCRFTDTPIPPLPATVTIDKLVVSSDGRPLPSSALPADFSFGVTPPSSSTQTLTATVDPLTLSGSTETSVGSAGSWTLLESDPIPSPGWRFQLLATSCQIGSDAPVSGSTASVSLDIPPGGDARCIYTDELVPTGGLIVRFTSIGGIGTFGARIESTTTGEELAQSATTSSPSSAEVALGDSTNPLLGTWLIIPELPSAGSQGRWVLDAAPSCDASAPVTPVGRDQLQVELGTPAAPLLTCDYVYRLLPPSTLQLSKITSGDQSLRSGNVVITARCDDGQTGTLTMTPAQSSPQSLGAAMSFPTPTICSVSETQNGASSASAVVSSSTLTVDGAASDRPLGELVVGSSSASEQVAVIFHNDYVAQAPTSTSTTAAQGGGTRAAAASLAYTGLPAALQAAALAGGGMLLAGAAMLLIRRRGTQR